MTATAHHPARLAASRAAVAPAPGAAARRRALGWTEPEPWTLAVLLATGLALLARHPISRAVGTEADSPSPAPTVSTAPARPGAGTGPAVPAAAAAIGVPTHAPRDPFRALVGPAGALLEGVAAAPTATAAHATASTVTPRTGASPAVPVAGCTGTVHRVVAGDSLWSIAASAVTSADARRITLAWHRIYAANRPPLGSDPSLVAVGTRLCIPSSV